MITYTTQATQSADEREDFETYDEALAAIKEYVEDDKRSGNYEEDFYEIKEHDGVKVISYYDEDGNEK